MANEAHLPKLQWTQRIALVRHNLHVARRTGDYSFFRTLQAHTVLDGTDHVAILYSILGDDADSILSTLDNLNAGIAYVHQDAFKAAYDGAKSTIYKANNTPSSQRSLIQVDICQQLEMADLTIDKTTNSAVNLIEAQPAHCQEAIANAWITGAIIIADAVCVCLKEMDETVENMDDFIRLEYSWNTNQNSADTAISALRGIFNLMATSNTPSDRAMSVSSRSVTSDAPARSRQSSSSSALGLIKRALSHSTMLSSTPPPCKSSRTGSVSMPMPDANSRGFRMSMSAACPTRMPNYMDQQPTALSPIPPTPLDNTPRGETTSPFGNKSDYFAFDMGKSQDAAKTSSASEDLLHLESLDPLYAPATDDNGKVTMPLTLRNLTETFPPVSAPSPIAV